MIPAFFACSHLSHYYSSYFFCFLYAYGPCICGRMSSLAFFQRTFDWGGEMALTVEESEGTGRHLLANVS